MTKKSSDNTHAAPSTKRSSPRVEKDADTKALEGDLSAAVRMPVSVNHKAGGEDGQVVISYRSLDELDEICRILSVS